MELNRVIPLTQWDFTLGVGPLYDFPYDIVVHIIANHVTPN